MGREGTPIVLVRKGGEGGGKGGGWVGGGMGREGTPIVLVCVC